MEVTRRTLAIMLLVAVASTGSAAAAVAVALRDGRVLEARSVERRDDLYLIAMKETVLTLPVDLVGEIRLSGPSRPDADLDGARRSATPELAEPAAPLPDIPYLPPPPIEEPEVAQGPAEPGFDRRRASFPSPPVDYRWSLEDSLSRKTDVAQFSPSAWPRPATDPSWRPQSAFGESPDLPDFSPARSYAPAVGQFWRPESGWVEAPGVPFAAD